MIIDRIKEKIVYVLEELYSREEKNRLDVVTFILSSQLLDVNSEKSLILIKKIQKMSLKQLELINLINEQFLNISSDEDEKLLEIMKNIRDILGNSVIEIRELQEIWLLSALYNLNDDEWFFMKNEIDFDYNLGPNPKYDTSSKDNFIFDLMEKSNIRENKFYDNYQKIKERREKKDE